MELSKAEAAKYLGVSARTLELYTKQGKVGVKYVKATRGKQARYHQSELEELKAALEVETHKPLVEQQPPQKVTNLESPSIELSGLVEKFVLPLSSHLAHLTTAVQNIQTSQTRPPLVPVAEKLLLTLPEAQALTGLSREILRDAINTGELPAKIIGKAWRIKRDDLEDYIDEL